jgi:uncharacterized delta-60 repeat protein
MRKGAFLLGLFFTICASVFGDGPPQQWAALYNGPGNDSELASDLVVDNSGNVYVTGSSYGDGTYNDYATVKYDSNGTQLWVKRYNGPDNGDDGASDIAIDLSGNVYVTGYSYGDGTGTDYATIKYNANGDQLWVKRYNGISNSDDSASALAVDGTGNVYVTGSSVGGAAGTDYATVKYGADGNQLWAARYNGPGNSDEEAYDLAIDGAGNVYVTGISINEDTSADYVTVKYDTNGNRLWVATYNGTENSDDTVSALKVDSSGNVYVTGTSYGGTTNYDYATVKYGTGGNQIWAVRYNGPGNDDDGAQDLAVDNGGNVYVTGYSYDSNTNYDYATVKYDHNGNQLWTARYNGPGNSGDYAYALVVDNSGNVYVTGISFDDNTANDYATVKYDSDGKQLWVARYNGTGNGDDYVSSIFVDNNGNVYTTGQSITSSTNFDYATIKYTQQGYCISPVAGDLNNDCKVDLEDFSIMASHWLECNYALEKDCQ